MALHREKIHKFVCVKGVSLRCLRRICTHANKQMGALLGRPALWWTSFARPRLSRPVASPLVSQFGWRFVWRHLPKCLAFCLASPIHLLGILVGVLEGGHPLCASQPFCLRGWLPVAGVEVCKVGCDNGSADKRPRRHRRLSVRLPYRRRP
jgi:hypothetical protein